MGCNLNLYDASAYINRCIVASVPFRDNGFIEATYERDCAATV